MAKKNNEMNKMFETINSHFSPIEYAMINGPLYELLHSLSPMECIQMTKSIEKLGFMGMIKELIAMVFKEKKKAKEKKKNNKK